MKETRSLIEWKNPICWSCKYYVNGQGCIAFSDFDLSAEELMEIDERNWDKDYYKVIDETNRHDKVLPGQTFAVTFEMIDGLNVDINSDKPIEYPDWYYDYKKRPISFEQFSPEFRAELEKKRIKPKRNIKPDKQK